MNLKNEELNYPEINLINFNLLGKFFKMVVKSDNQILKKLILLISKPIYNKLRRKTILMI